MVNSYILVNPYIQGEFKNKLNAKNSIEAARKFYKEMSNHFNNSVPKFYFTIQKGQSGGGKYYHFEIKEKLSKNENVNFSIEPYTIYGDSDMSSFSNKLNTFKNKFNQSGGEKDDSSESSEVKHKKHEKKSKKYDNSDSDSSEDSVDFYRKAKSYTINNSIPFYYWWYDPYVYKLDSFWIPTFYSYVTPYIEISLKP
jgi:hypothetical protein